VWQFGIVIFVCLTGCLPWQKAGSDDPRYVRYLHWHGSNGVLMPVRRPKLFKLITSKAQRMFRKFLEPRPEKRPGGLADLARFLEDRWLTRTSLDRQTGESHAQRARLDPFLLSYLVILKICINYTLKPV
jgi:serine/threonine-protein kinase SBK